MGGGKWKALINILQYSKSKKEKYVIMADTNIAANFDFNALIAQHVKTDADITFNLIQRYHTELTGAKDASKGLYYALLKLDGDKVEDIYIQLSRSRVCRISL